MEDSTNTDMGAAKPVEAAKPVANPLAGGISQQLMAMQPDEMAAMAQSLDPDVRSSLAQALFSAMSPEEKAACDNTPGSDVQNAMGKASPERPEQQYQMSVTRAMKRAEQMPGMGLVADEHLSKWQQRIISLTEDGYMSEEDSKARLARFDKAGQNRFSVLVDGGGFLHDDMVAIEALEKARAGTATLSKSVIAGRFGVAKPVLPSKKVKDDAQADAETFDRAAAEAAGSRLARMN